MATIKYIIGACVLLLVVGAASSTQSEPARSPVNSLVTPVGSYPTTVDMRRFYNEFRN